MTTDPDLRALFATVPPPSTLDRHWREAAVVGYQVRSPVRSRVLVMTFVAALVLTGGAVVSKLGAPPPARAPLPTEPAPPPAQPGSCERQNSSLCAASRSNLPVRCTSRPCT
jgi:hypothetical protein